MPTNKSEVTPSLTSQITISQLPMEILVIPIKGITPLISNRFGPKKRLEIAEIEAQKKKVKMPRDPVSEYNDSFYRLSDGQYGFPLTAFKSCTVAACRFYDRSVSMQAMKQYLWFDPEHYDEDGIAVVPLEHDEDSPRMRCDTVRVRSGGTTLRYRAQFTNWKTTVRVRYVMSSINMDSVVSLMNSGGLNVGVGEWRPEKGTSGTFGCWQVDTDKGIGIEPFIL